MLRIHSCLPKLLCIHLSKTFVTLDLIVAVTTNFCKNLVQFVIAVCVPYLLVLLQLIQRRLCKIYISLFDQIRHETIQECQKKCTDVRSIDIGIGHDNDLVISQLTDIKIFVDSRSKCCDHCLNLSISVNLIKTCFLYVQNLTTKWQDCLSCTVSGCLCRTAGGISLDDIDLTLGRIFI